jgi:hypothetical protein
LVADGAGALTTNQDIYNYPASLRADESFTGTYGIQASGRGAAALPATDYHVYLASDSHVFVIGMNPGEVRFGTALRHE